MRLRLTKMILSGAKLLEINRTMVDALNVFPVPDGDTGTNMSLTIQSAVKECNACKTNKMADIADAVARGALRGARGNSGVILSQIFRGLFQELKKGDYEEISVCSGEMICISPIGTVEKSRFHFSNYDLRNWWEYGLYSRNSVTAEYIDDLKCVASFQGIPPEYVDELLDEGFGLDEVEEYLYGV